MSEAVVALPNSAGAFAQPRMIPPEDWNRYRENMAEILEALGLPPGTPGTRDTPERFLRALFEATAGYDGDPKLVTTFPTESDSAGATAYAQIVEQKAVNMNREMRTLSTGAPLARALSRLSPVA